MLPFCDLLGQELGGQAKGMEMYKCAAFRPFAPIRFHHLEHLAGIQPMVDHFHEYRNGDVHSDHGTPQCSLDRWVLARCRSIRQFDCDAIFAKGIQAKGSKELKGTTGEFRADSKPIFARWRDPQALDHRKLMDHARAELIENRLIQTKANLSVRPLEMAIGIKKIHGTIPAPQYSHVPRARKPREHSSQMSVLQQVSFKAVSRCMHFGQRAGSGFFTALS
ncbi:MAG: hypothetical protein HY289_04595 [Planctomycetes bacterium]|nr:hypothetical protein [Planctomycetota bacterium]